ncbi:transposase [Actinoplanes lutulentus]|nr:ISL3 family transposase [Actinoplanes lutulentus]MBB2940475.1 transposase [Actinoplanes lutulentus]
MAIEDITESGGGVRLRAAARGTKSQCPRCLTWSARVHSRYRRLLADLPVAGRLVELSLTVRRFFCGNVVCESRTFVEQVDGLTRRRARRSEPLREMLTSIGLALAGRAGTRLASKIGIRTSRNSLLRLVRALPDPDHAPAAILGVDDFAIRRGQNYGTVLVDCESQRVIDLLPGRDAAPLTAWLHDHEPPAVICRDRASAYAEAAKAAAPDAVQVADRFHLWQNLATAVDRLARRHRTCLTEQPAVLARNDAEEVPEPTGTMAQRRRKHHALVHELIGQGAGFRQIARHLGWSHNTVSRYAHAATWQELMTTQKRRPSLLDPFKPYLITRIDNGCLKARLLHREVTAQGFTGGYGIVRAFIEQHRHRPDLRTQPRPLSPRQVTGWICRHPDNLSEHDTSRLHDVLTRCPELHAAADLVRAFGEIMTRRHGHRLADWISTAEQAELPGISRFVNGLKSDLAAVTAGLTLPFSSGPVEGNVNRIKTLKRQMYGRANFDLLRKRVLLSA